MTTETHLSACVYEEVTRVEAGPAWVCVFVRYAREALGSSYNRMIGRVEEETDDIARIRICYVRLESVASIAYEDGVDSKGSATAAT